jgi:gluconolactonase
MHAKWIISAAFIGILVPGLCQGASLVTEGADIKKLAGDFSFTEGPAADKDGNIFFTDIPANRIHKWSVDGKLSIFLDNSGGANGLFIDKDGQLLAVQGGGRQLVSIDANGKITTLADKYDGKPFNSLNDLWIHPNGGVYFTDPRYGNRDGMEQDGEHVYFLSPDLKTVTRVINDLVRPNGLIGTPDGKTLYVADQGDGKTFVYTIQADNTLTNKKLFCSQGSDGMTLDEQGNVYLTGQAVDIYKPDGTKLESIAVPETPANVCFGGADKQTLFITARTSLYSIRMQVKGVN